MISRALTKIMFGHRFGMPFPRELARGHSMLCWRRLHERMIAGAWQHVYEAILRRLHEYEYFFRDRSCIDVERVPAPMRGVDSG